MGDHVAVVIGGGPAGLSAANELAGRGIKPLVLEKLDKVGGLSRTESHKGFRFDIGGHRFYTRNEVIERLWTDMLGDDMLKVARLSRIVYGGRFFNYPLNLSNTLANLGPAESLLILLSYLGARLRPQGRQETFDRWVASRFGRRLYDKFFKTYTEKVWGIPCTEIRADWAAQRIGELSTATAIRSALFGSNGRRTLATEFLYPALGAGMMWQRFQEAIESKGGQVRLRCEAERVTHRNGRVESVTFRDGYALQDVPVRHLISSVAMSELVERLWPPPPDSVLSAARNLRYRDFLLVTLIVGQPGLFPDNWVYVHEPGVRVARIQNYTNWSSAMSPDPQKSCLGMEYFCFAGDDLWTLPDSGLIDLASGEIEALGLVRRRDVEDGAVIRQRGAYPVYDAGYRSNVQTVSGYLDTFENLQTVGRNGMHRYNNIDHSMLAGLLAARNVLGERHDVWRVNTDEPYCEPAPTAVARG